jgi:hypothetical protein
VTFGNGYFVVGNQFKNAVFGLGSGLNKTNNVVTA